MTSRFARLLALAALFVASNTHAQLTIDIVGVGAQQIPVAVAGFAGADPNAQQMSSVIEADLGRSGYESVAELNADTALKAKIEALISHIQGLENATFVRNGSEYSAANAAKFLRAKWERNDKEVKTATDFIAKVASASGTSGKPYVIRFKDGKETPCGEYLTALLKKQ